RPAQSAAHKEVLGGHRRQGQSGGSVREEPQVRRAPAVVPVGLGYLKAVWHGLKPCPDAKFCSPGLAEAVPLQENGECSKRRSAPAAFTTRATIFVIDFLPCPFTVLTFLCETCGHEKGARMAASSAQTPTRTEDRLSKATMLGMVAMGV